MGHWENTVSDDETFFIDEINQMIRGRWNAIEQMTRYGWLSSMLHRNFLCQEESSAILTLVKKINSHDVHKILDTIRNRSSDLHPRHISVVAISVLEEAYMAQILRSQGKRPIRTKKAVKHGLTSVFTIS